MKKNKIKNLDFILGIGFFVFFYLLFIINLYARDNGEIAKIISETTKIIPKNGNIFDHIIAIFKLVGFSFSNGVFGYIGSIISGTVLYILGNYFKNKKISSLYISIARFLISKYGNKLDNEEGKEKAINEGIDLTKQQLGTLKIFGANKNSIDMLLRGAIDELKKADKYLGEQAKPALK